MGDEEQYVDSSSNTIFHRCSICGKYFDDVYQRKLHMEKHTQYFDFEKGTKVVCDQCPKTFTTKQGLKMHLLSHEEEKSQDKKLQCEKCPKKFHSEKVLNRHMYFKHSEKTFCCEKLAQKNALN